MTRCVGERIRTTSTIIDKEDKCARDLVKRVRTTELGEREKIFVESDVSHGCGENLYYQGGGKTVLVIRAVNMKNEGERLMDGKTGYCKRGGNDYR